MKTLIINLICICAICIILAFQAFSQESVWASLYAGGVKSFEQGDYKEAERLFRSCINEAGKFNVAENPKAIGMMSDSLSGLAGSLRGQDKLADAEVIVRKQIQLLEMSSDESDQDYSKTLNNLGLLLSEQQKYKEAEETHRKAIKLREKYDDPEHRNLAISLLNLGKVYYDQNIFPEAEALFNQSRKIFSLINTEDLTSDDLENILVTDNNLALIYVEQKKYKAAELRYKTVILFTEKLKGKSHPDLIQYLENYAKLLRITKRLLEAKKLESRIALIRKNTL